MPNKREGKNYHFWTEGEDALIRDAYSRHPIMFDKFLTSRFSVKRLTERAKTIRARKNRFLVVHCNNIPTEALIYMAGFMDADGSVYFNNQNNRYFMTFANDDTKVLLWMKSLIGDGATLESKGTESRHFQLMVRRTADVAYVLEGMAPYLHVKKEKALAAIQFNGKILDSKKDLT